MHEAYLRSALGKYQYPDIAKRDILNAIQQFKDLRPNTDTYVFNNGQRKELLQLSGTIPVNYKGNTYNIPICLWLMESHPYNPPMVYVKPTATMQVKQGKHVDANGKIYLPYLHEWKHPQSDLYGLIQILTIIFGDEPPVYSRSAGQPPPTSTYPGQGANPPYPVAGGAGMPMPGTGGYPGGGGPGYPAATASQYPGYPSYNQPAMPAQTSYPGYPGYPGSTQAPTQTASAQQSMPPVPRQSTLSDDTIRISLLSGVEDKMRRKLKDIFSQAQAEMDTLQRTQDDLNRGKKTLEDMLTKLEKEQNDVERSMRVLQEKDGEMEELINKMEGQSEVSIDEAVMPTAPLYRQLLECFAEEQATEDAIYYLTEGLKRQVIDLDVYLKQVRELSRRQFQMRALIQRCRQKAGLPEVASG